MNKQITNPDLIDVLNTLKGNIFENLNCHKIGIIQKFNSTNQTAEIQLIDKIIAPDGTIVTRSLLVDCPIIILKGGNARMTFPIKKDDCCLVLFNDNDIDNWFEAGGINELNTSRKHDLNDAIAIVGLFSSNNSLEEYDVDGWKVKNNDSQILLKEGGGELNIDDKIELKNTLTSLKSIMDNLVTLLLALQVVDPISGLLPIDATTVTALNNLQIQINNLLK